MGHKVCQEAALWVFSNHSRVFSWPSYFSKTNDCFSYLEHCCLKGLVWWFDMGFGEPLVLLLILLNLDAILPSCVLKKKVKLKSSFSNRPWKRKPLYAHKTFSSRMNLTWYKPKVWNSSTGSQYFFQMAFKHLYKMHVCVYWELATQHDVCWLISHGQKTFFLLNVASFFPYYCICVFLHVLIFYKDVMDCYLLL